MTSGLHAWRDPAWRYARGPARCPSSSSSRSSRVYGEEIEVYALRDVSLQVLPGDFISIVGPSGSGKSTMLGLLGVLDLPTSGIIRIAGQDVSLLDDPTRSKLRGDSIGFVFQQFHLIPHLTALGQRGDRSPLPGHPAEGAPGAGPGGPGPARPGRPRRPPAGADVGRRAAAGGPGTCHRDRPAHDPGRRADRGARLGQRRPRPRYLPAACSPPSGPWSWSPTT